MGREIDTANGICPVRPRIAKGRAFIETDLSYGGFRIIPVSGGFAASLGSAICYHAETKDGVREQIDAAAWAEHERYERKNA